MTTTAITMLSVQELPPLMEPTVALKDDVFDKSSQILAIIMRHSLKKLSDAEDRLNLGTPHFLAIIEKFVKADQTIQMCLPAFPFKSANKAEKALSHLPDKAEEVALQLLNELCEDIRNIYDPGAHLTIISDGLMYNGMILPDMILIFVSDCDLLTT
jgi:ATP-binding cassette subfamily G (WHITE) protein 2 (PDR)